MAGIPIDVLNPDGTTTTLYFEEDVPLSYNGLNLKLYDYDVGTGEGKLAVSLTGGSGEYGNVISSDNSIILNAGETVLIDAKKDVSIRLVPTPPADGYSAVSGNFYVYGNPLTSEEILFTILGNGGGIILPTDAYINLGSTTGSEGYGIRDNGGTIELKNKEGTWTAIGGSGYWSRDIVNGSVSPLTTTDNLLMGDDTYINFGSTGGSGGYGLRDNDGVIESSDEGGSWLPIGSATSYWVRDAVNGTLTPTTSTDTIICSGIQIPTDTGYINFGDTIGIGGYGFADVGGSLYYKELGGDWVGIGGIAYWSRDSGTGIISTNTLTDSLVIGDSTSTNTYIQSQGITIRNSSLVITAGLAYNGKLLLEYTGSTGNSIDSSSTTITTGNLVYLEQGTSNFQGAGILMNFGMTSGSFTNGDYILCKLNSVQKFKIDCQGNVDCGRVTAVNNIITSDAIAYLSSTSVTSGSGLCIEIGTGAGFDGYFVDFTNSSVSKFSVNYAGNIISSGSCSVNSLAVTTTATAHKLYALNSTSTTDNLVLVEYTGAASYSGDMISILRNSSAAAFNTAANFLKCYDGVNERFSIHHDGTVYANSSISIISGGLGSGTWRGGLLVNPTANIDGIDVYSSTCTNHNLLSLYSDNTSGTGSFTGCGLIMDFQRGTGAFTGYYINCQLNSSEKFKVDYQGYCTAVKFYGDGSNLTGITNYWTRTALYNYISPTTAGDRIVLGTYLAESNLITSTSIGLYNSSGNLGFAVDNTGVLSLTYTGTTSSGLSVTSTTITTGNLLYLNADHSTFSNDSTSLFIKCYNDYTNITTFSVNHKGTCTAVKFVGDGSSLTNINGGWARDAVNYVLSPTTANDAVYIASPGRYVLPHGFYAALAVNLTGTTNTQGVLIQSDTVTSGNMLGLYHTTSACTGSALIIYMASGSGTFSAATSTFIDCRVNSVAQFGVGYNGYVYCGGLLSISNADLDIMGRAGKHVRIRLDETTASSAFQVRINNGTETTVFEVDGTSGDVNIYNDLNLDGLLNCYDIDCTEVRASAFDDVDPITGNIDDMADSTDRWDNIYCQDIYYAHSHVGTPDDFTGNGIALLKDFKFQDKKNLHPLLRTKVPRKTLEKEHTKAIKKGKTSKTKEEFIQDREIDDSKDFINVSNLLSVYHKSLLELNERLTKLEKTSK